MAEQYIEGTFDALNETSDVVIARKVSVTLNHTGTATVTVRRRRVGSSTWFTVATKDQTDTELSFELSANTRMEWQLLCSAYTDDVNWSMLWNTTDRDILSR